MTSLFIVFITIVFATIFSAVMMQVQTERLHVARNERREQNIHFIETQLKKSTRTTGVLWIIMLFVSIGVIGSLQFM